MISRVLLFGDEPKYPCMIKCNGQGPVVSIIPDIMDFGEIVCLKEQKKLFNVVNESPIPAELSVFGVRLLKLIT